MRKIFPAEDLARDSRFRRADMEDRFQDPRMARIASGNGQSRPRTVERPISASERMILPVSGRKYAMARR